MELNGIFTVVLDNFAPLLNGENSKPTFFQGSHESKTAKAIPAGKWKVYYLGFSKGGWNEHAQAYADLINQSLPEGQSKNASWQVAGIQLFSLADIDRDMIEWS